MKYRKKPIVIEAFKWTGGPDQDQEPDWIVRAVKDKCISFNYYPGTSDVQMVIETLEGSHTASQGDFIIQGIKGELYPCKPDIFLATYDKVDA